ncbi:MAG: tyrosine-protein phosphatase [Erysipelotrichaceae bacterium]|nr:tyrosine-protein phosphatase [Erysipelotrichaceae bacterium]
MKKKWIVTILIAAALIAALWGIWTNGKTEAPAKQETVSEEVREEEAGEESVLTSVAKIKKSGNVVLQIKASELLEKGIEFGDIIDVAIGDKEFSCPVCYNYSNVAVGENVCVPDTAEEDDVTLASNGLDFASTSQIAVKKKTDEDPGYVWEALTDLDSVKISIGEKKGYENVLKFMVFDRSNERSDYPDLSDEAYANFRSVDIGDLKEGILYRSSSPINPSLKRNTQADEAARKAGVKVMIDLQDKKEEAEAYEGFADSYYASVNDVFLPMTYDFFSDDSKEVVRKAMEAIIDNEGPYLIHCKEGKDRTGFLCAILGSLMNASYEEICDDYMETYFNFFDASLMKEGYDIIVYNNIRTVLCKAYQIETPETEDLQKCAVNYLIGCGLSETRIEQLRTRLQG